LLLRSFPFEMLFSLTLPWTTATLPKSFTYIGPISKDSSLYLNHMIVAHEVTHIGNYRSQLTDMAKLARDALGTKSLTALADRGYYNGEEIQALGA
jgi:hypothetical protein